MATFVILFREALEVVLILSIVITLLRKQSQQVLLPFVGYGVAAALGASVLLGLGLLWILGIAKAQSYNALIEGVLLILASGFILYLVIWMHQKHNPALQLKQELATAQSGWGIGLVVFFAVIREGIETVLFLSATATQADSPLQAGLGAFAGVALAVAIGWLIIKTGAKLPIKQFFRISSVLLVMLAAGMAAYGVHELEEYMVQESVVTEANITRPWDVLKPQPLDSMDGSDEAAGLPWYYTTQDGKAIHWLHDNGAIGKYLKTFLGYNSNPNWIELFVWLLVLVFGLYLVFRPQVQVTPQPAVRKMAGTATS